MQDLINKFYKGKINIKGYFIKTRVSKKEMNTKIGLLSDKANKKLEGNRINKFDAYNYEQILRDSEMILRKIDEYGGVLPFSESASPDIIRRELQMSKNGFKKALGSLLKAGKILKQILDLK